MHKKLSRSNPSQHFNPTGLLTHGGSVAEKQQGESDKLGGSDKDILVGK